MKIKPYAVGSIGTNSYLVWDEESGEAMLVDPGAFEPAIEREIAESGLSLKYIALTHGHGDHIGGVKGFQAAHPGALLAAGAGEAGFLGDAEQNGSQMFFGEKIALAPDVLLGEGDGLLLGALRFCVIETPGHTPGGVAFYIAEADRALTGQAFSGTAFTGDTLFRASVGRTDLAGGDFAALGDSIRNKLFALPDDTLVLPGHMDATTIGFERKHNPFVRGSAD
ncbi:MAG: MBL fold metallo-hydrolase [Clostridiales Family XIII bacterium]|jgi:glyoxylase-like metal-dependent hydrolase (beta-lactamase superfamily II)|nr:MBL fold metallo-hydrolase [Clostridiales Family XIII bacterium]